MVSRLDCSLVRCMNIGLAWFIYSSGVARQFCCGPAEVSGGCCDYVMQYVIPGQVGSDGDGLQMKRAFIG